MDKIVFISSTYQDLAEHRRAVWEVLERFKVAVRGMEQFGARSTTPKETCLGEVDQCDVYVGIVAFRLGSIDAESGKSFTQLEYEHAHRQGKKILIYLVDEQEARFRRIDFDFDPSQRGRLEAFKGVLKERHTVNWFSSPEDLAGKLKTDFKELFPPITPEKAETPESEFESTIALVRRFRLLPGSVNGREVRLEIRPLGNVFPASRALCNAFNLEYGRTVGIQIRVVKPDPRVIGGFYGDRGSFEEIYAGGLRVDKFLSLMDTRKPLEVYARLRFTPDDVPSRRAVFFGYSYYNDYEGPEPEDPNEIYIAPEGRVILLFSKAAL